LFTISALSTRKSSKKTTITGLDESESSYSQKRYSS